MSAALAATVVTLGFILVFLWVGGFAHLWIEDKLPGWIAIPLMVLPFVVGFWFSLFTRAGGIG